MKEKRNLQNCPLRHVCFTRTHRGLIPTDFIFLHKKNYLVEAYDISIVRTALYSVYQYLADRKIGLYRLSQILNYKTDGSLVNFRRKPFQSTQKTTDKWTFEGMPIFDVDLHCNTFKIRFWAVDTQAYGGAGAIAPEHAAAKRGQHPFFFLVQKKGVRPHPPNPPWLRACCSSNFVKNGLRPC